MTLPVEQKPEWFIRLFGNTPTLKELLERLNAEQVAKQQ